MSHITNNSSLVIFWVLMAASVKAAVKWNVIPYNLDQSPTFQKTSLPPPSCLKIGHKQIIAVLTEQHFKMTVTLMTLSAEPVANHSLPGSTATQRTHPKWPDITRYNFHGACHFGFGMAVARRGIMLCTVLPAAGAGTWTRPLPGPALAGTRAPSPTTAASPV